MTESAVPNSDQDTVASEILAHVLPFVAWLLLMKFLPREAWAYGVRSVVCLGLFIYLRPWEGYARFRGKTLLWALPAGVLVCVIWVLPESGWMPAGADHYLRWGMWPPWRVFLPAAESPYDPAICGWPLSIVRLAGSAFIIAVIEEFFWRGFLYRWLIENDFMKVDPRRRHWPMFLAVAVLFGLEHTRWLAGIFAGLVYGELYIRTGNIWCAVAAHVTTNLLLGWYVLHTGAFSFW